METKLESSEMDNRRAGVSCIINPKAAKKKWLRKKGWREFIHTHLPGAVHDIYGSREDTIDLAKKLCPGSRTVVAVGGDGTIADVLQGIFEAGKQGDILFGIIPLGSGNAFRKSLRIPKNLKKAVKVLAGGATRKIDLISVEGRPAGFASIGATAGVTREKLRHRIQGFWGHVLAGRSLLFERIKEREVELFDGLDERGNSFDYKKFRIKFLDCVAAKTNYFGYNWRIAPQAELEDGFLDITFFEVSGLKYALVFPLIYFGLFQRTQRHFKARKMIIRGDDLPVQYNGEFLEVKDKVEVEVLPRAIRVICPPGTDNPA